MYVTATDAELVTMGMRQASSTTRLYAERLNLRVTQAEDARKALEHLINTHTLVGVVHVDDLDTILALIDWRFDVPGHSQMTTQLRRENKIVTVKL